jgi:hypothetical protein
MERREGRNPFYPLLLLAGILFVVTALAFAVVPALEDRAIESGQPPPPSAFHDALRTDGGRWLLYEVGALTFFGLASMGLDRLRSLQRDRARARMAPHEPLSG